MKLLNHRQTQLLLESESKTPAAPQLISHIMCSSSISLSSYSSLTHTLCVQHTVGHIGVQYVHRLLDTLFINYAMRIITTCKTYLGSKQELPGLVDGHMTNHCQSRSTAALPFKSLWVWWGWGGGAISHSSDRYDSRTDGKASSHRDGWI